MHEGGLHGHIAQRRSPKLIAIIRVSRHLFPAEVFIGVRAIERSIGNLRNKLWDPDDVRLEVAEHFIGAAGDRVARHTARLAKEQQSASLLVLTQPTRLCLLAQIDQRERSRT